MSQGQSPVKPLSESGFFWRAWDIHFEKGLGLLQTRLDFFRMDKAQDHPELVFFGLDPSLEAFFSILVLKVLKKLCF